MSQMSTIFHEVVRKGWQVTPLEEGWQLNHIYLKGALYMHATEQWINLTYPLSIADNNDQPEQAIGDRVLLYRHLLEQNEHMYMAKFCLDDEDRPLLTAEFSARSTHHVLLNWALDAMLCYGDSASLQEEPPVDGGYYEPDIMPGLPKTTIFRYIKGVESRQWLLKEEPKDAGLSWHLGYRGRFRLFNSYLAVTKNWTYFQVPLLVEATPSVLLEEDLRLQVLFLKYLLQLNMLWFMARLGISKDGCLLLLMDVPTETLDFALFQLATSTLANYLDRYEQELQIMASLQHDRQLTALLR